MVDFSIIYIFVLLTLDLDMFSIYYYIVLSIKLIIIFQSMFIIYFKVNFTIYLSIHIFIYNKSYHFDKHNMDFYP